MLIPARDEVAHIEATVRSVLAQTGVPRLTVLVLDDGSSDGTADDRAAPRRRGPAGSARRRFRPAAAPGLARQAVGLRTTVGGGARIGSRVRRRRCRPPAVGGPRDGRDPARQRLRPRRSLPAPVGGDLAGAPRAAARDVVLGAPPCRCAGPRRRPGRRCPRRTASSWCSTPTATARAGGHAAVRDDVIEDVALMRAVKASGRRTATVDGSHLAECRMYDGTAAVVDGYAKSLWSAFNGPAGSVAVCALLSTAYVLPAVAAVWSRDRRTRSIGTVGYAAGRPAARSSPGARASGCCPTSSRSRRRSPPSWS